jgi:hypothetical protein
MSDQNSGWHFVGEPGEPQFQGDWRNRSEWSQKLEAAAACLTQHTLSGPLIIGGVERDDLYAVRAEDWDALQQALSTRTPKKDA